MTLRRLGSSGSGLTQVSAITALGISPNGRFAITGDAQGIARVFDLHQRTQVAETRVPTSVAARERALSAVHVSDHGRLVLLRAREALAWGRCELPAPLATLGADSWTRVALSPAGDFWVRRGARATTFRGTAERGRYAEKNGAADDVAISGGGLVALLFHRSPPDNFATEIGSTLVVRTLAGKTVARLELDDPSSDGSIGFLDEQRVLAVTKHEVHEWNFKNGKLSSRPKKCDDDVRVLGPLAMVHRGDQVVDPRTGKVRLRGVRHLAVSADAQVVLTAKSGVITRRDPSTFDELEPPVSPLRTDVRAVAYEPSGAALWTADDERLQRFTLPDGTPDVSVELKRGAIGARLSLDATWAIIRTAVMKSSRERLVAVKLPEGTRHGGVDSWLRYSTFSRGGTFVTGAAMGVLGLHDLTKKKSRVRLAKFTTEEPRGGCAVSPDETLLVSRNRAGFHVWDFATLKLLRTFSHGSDLALSMAVSRNVLIAGLERPQVLIISLASGKLLHALRTKRKSIYQVAISADAKRVAACDGVEVSVWDVKSGKRTQVHDVKANALAFSPDSKQLAIGAAGAVFLVDV